MEIDKMIHQKKGTIVDVRTIEEFNDGHANEAVNIPLHELALRINELRTLEAPLILCCASGNRSGQAQRFLSSNGFDCVNAGPWREVYNIQKSKV